MDKNNMQSEEFLKPITETVNPEYAHLQVDTIIIPQFSNHRKVILTFKVGDSFVDYKGIVSLEEAKKIIDRAKSVFGNELDLNGIDIDSDVYSD